MTRLADGLNTLLPGNFYAMAEQVAGSTIPDVLTLENIAGPLEEQGFDLDDEGDIGDEQEGGGSDDSAGGGLAVMAAAPRSSLVQNLSEATLLALKRRHLAIRHATDDRVVASLEIVSPGNKSARGPLEMLVDKAIAALQRGVHVAVIDLLPPGTFDPDGLHDRLWSDLGGGRFTPPADRPLTLASYRATGSPGDVVAYVEPTAVGLEPVALPLFFTTERYVNIPLAETYAATYAAFPRRWRRVIEGNS